MIDALDKQTQALPFEPVKRGRGRPRTGKAMTPAEKQRAYRERQKAESSTKGNVTVNGVNQGNLVREQHEVIVELSEKIIELTVANDRLKAELKELESRKSVTKKRYLLQFRDPVEDKWVDSDSRDFGKKSEAVEACARMNEPGFSSTTWRIREREWV